MSRRDDPRVAGVELCGARAVVLGLGVTGAATAAVLARAGADVLASESGEVDPARRGELESLGIRVEAGGHREALQWIEHADIVVPSPGIPLSASPVAEALAQGRTVMSEIELASRMTQAPVLAVTGTNGKTTTAMMIGQMLAADGRSAVTCGNIGLPFVSAVAEHPEAEAFVVEVSSFQLALCDRFHPRVAVVTNLAPDHIDWHGSMQEYAAAKARIAARQTPDDWFVFPARQPDLADMAPVPGPVRLAFDAAALPERGAGVRGGRVAVRLDGGERVDVADAAPLTSRGRPFLEDGVAAAAAAMAFGVGAHAAGGVLTAFVPDNHRMQPAGEVEGVRFIDDSKATNPHATLAALAGLSDVVLIAGGRSRSGDLQALSAAAGKLRGVVAIGEAAGEVMRVLGPHGVRASMASDMQEAVATAFAMARGGGGVVLLSPACASLDQFDSYAHRGRVFKDAVARLGAGDTQEDR